MEKQYLAILSSVCTSYLMLVLFQNSKIIVLYIVAALKYFENLPLRTAHAQ